MSRNPLQIPAKPDQITLATLPALFAHHRAMFGGWQMTQAPGESDPPERPEGVSEEEWNALGDPGRSAIVREREARQSAERALAAARARPVPPKKAAKAAAPAAPAKDDPPETDPSAFDFKALIKEAVSEAVKPFQEAEEQRRADEAVNKVLEAVQKAAQQQFKDDDDTSGAARVFHNPANALSMIDLTQVVDENGGPDEAKIKTELATLLKREPHLGKLVDTRRVTAPGSGAGAGGASVPLKDRVQDTLARMQASAGLKVTAKDN